MYRPQTLPQIRHSGCNCTHKPACHIVRALHLQNTTCGETPLASAIEDSNPANSALVSPSENLGVQQRESQSHLALVPDRFVHWRRASRLAEGTRQSLVCSELLVGVLGGEIRFSYLVFHGYSLMILFHCQLLRHQLRHHPKLVLRPNQDLRLC